VSETFEIVQQTLIGDAIASSDHAVLVSEEGPGKVIAVNEAACRLLGYSRDELLRMRPAEWSARSAEELTEIYEQLNSRRAFTATARLRRKDERLVEVDYWGSWTHVGGIGYLLTVTEPVQLARPV
jgi:PAS domain S-box-containing protein